MTCRRQSGARSRSVSLARLHCAEVLSLAPTPTGQSELGAASDVNAGQALPQVRVLVIAERVDGFFLERLTDRGELVGTTQHETMDEAMQQVYSEFVIGDWRSCPEDVDPVEYIGAQSG
jgi:hypothetical protein